MAIFINEVLEELDDRVRARIRHNGSEFNACVFGSPLKISSSIGTELVVEISYESVVASRRIEDFDDSDSIIMSESPESEILLVRGRVHSIIEDGSGGYIVDLYLQTGPEFITATSEELGFVPEIDSGLELELEGVCFYPTSL